MHGVRFEHEGSVLSGTPALKFAAQALQGLRGLRVDGFEGILNGTSNYVLGRMAHGVETAEAVREAKMQGFAEADPTADLGGSDIALKVQILANCVLGADIPGRVTPSSSDSAHRPWRCASATRQTSRRMSGQ